MTVDELLSRYGVGVERYEGVARHLRDDGLLRYDAMGPSGVAGVRWPDAVVAEWIAAPEYVLHEGVHLICATKLSDLATVPEEDGLLQMERTLARHLPLRDRRRVLDYQYITSLSFDLRGQMAHKHQRAGYAEVGDWKRPTRSGWWRYGAGLAMAAGLLTPDGKPTWKRHKEMGR